LRLKRARVCRTRQQTLCPFNNQVVDLLFALSQNRQSSWAQLCYHDHRRSTALNFAVAPGVNLMIGGALGCR
jgi:hypothetical protein